MIKSVKKEFEKELNFKDDQFNGIVTFSEDEEDDQHIVKSSKINNTGRESFRKNDLLVPFIK